MKPFPFLIAALAGLLSCHPENNKNKAAEGNQPAAQELAGFKVPEDFIIELIASEEDGIVKPIDITFDDAGRLWTQTASMYPLDPVADIRWNDLLDLMNHPEKQKDHPSFRRISDLYQGKTRGEDKILVLSDLYDYANPQAKVQVWADGLTIPMSILPYQNGAYVAQGSELFFLDDTDKDGKADRRDSLFTGFGFTDTHTMAHSLVRGPAGWIYFSQGALNKGEVTSYRNDTLKVRIDYSKIARFTGDGKRMELVTPGLNNIWGFQLRANGQWYITEANDLGYSVVPMDPGTALPGIGNEKFRTYQPWLPELHKFRVGGTGISGLAFADDASGSFPPEWKDVAFLANPITSTINAVKIKRNADGTITAQHLDDFLTSEDKYFRPVNIEFGPDGSLYIADWYNKIISHNEIPTTHPDRDKTRGRIWRIRHKSQTNKAITDYYQLPAVDLPAQLALPALWAKRAALHQITDRPLAQTKTLVPALTAMVADNKQDEATRIHALWALEGLKLYDAGLIKMMLQSSGADNLKREAIRSLTSFDLSPGELSGLLSPLVDDANALVRSQVLRTLGEAPQMDSSTIAVVLKACKPELAGNDLGGSYERKFERYLALRALEKNQAVLISYLNSHQNIPAQQLLWASMALPAPEKEKWLLKALEQAPLTDLKETEFVQIAMLLKNPGIFNAVKPALSAISHVRQYLETALRNEDLVQSPALAQLLQPGTENLLRSSKTEEVNLALNAVARLKVQVPRPLVTSLLNEQSDDETIKLALNVLERNSKENKDIFLQVAKNEKLNFTQRCIALRNLCASDGNAAANTAQQIVARANEEQKKVLASVLSASPAGATLLKKLYGQKMLGTNAFTISSAERIRNADTTDNTGKVLYAAVEQQIEAEKKAFANRLEKYRAIAGKKDGDPEKGKQIFQTVCLMCHKVGNKGQDIAPALDGSANRETEALLTAILNPDAAVEGGYEIFRVTKKDNSILEGYLYKKGDNGITLAVMGGQKIFIPASDIKSTQTLGGRSFMPKGLIDQYSDEEVAGLLAYIKTLE